MVCAAADILIDSGNNQAISAAFALTFAALERTGHKNVWRIISRNGKETYLVHPDGCNCKAGLHEVFCYHRIAAAILAA